MEKVRKKQAYASHGKTESGILPRFAVTSLQAA
jgi:hypothetical protein